MVSTLAVVGFVVGFPVAMFIAWIFDITPDGGYDSWLPLEN